MRLMSEKNVMIEVFEKNFAARTWSSCRDPRDRVKKPEKFTCGRRQEKARLPEIGLSLFKALAWWTTLKSKRALYVAALLLSTTSSLCSIERPTRARSRVGKVEEEEKKKEKGKNALGRASTKIPPNRSRDRMRKTVIPVQRKNLTDV